jgi:tight adherence protein B
MALTVGCLAIGCVSGAPIAFAGAGVAALILLAMASRTESQARIERQTPTAIRLLASGLRAGYSVPQALDLVARESPQPTADEFARVVQEVQLGATLEEAIGRLAERTTGDYALVATIVVVQHETGGNLAQSLDSVSQTLQERSELRQHAVALTAQQRLSALILTSMPIAVFLYMWAVNPEYLQPLMDSLLGRMLLLLAGALLALGWMAMGWMGRVEE